MLNVFLHNFYQIEIMHNTFSLSLIIWKTAIETCDQEMNGAAENELGARRAEQFPNLGNYTFTPAFYHLWDGEMSADFQSEKC